jgi:hypothetical protein
MFGREDMLRKAQQLGVKEFDAKTIDRLQTTLKSRIESMFAARLATGAGTGAGIQTDGAASMAGFMKQQFPGYTEKGQEKQARMVQELVPLLDGAKISHSVPTGQGVMFVSGTKHLTMSIAVTDNKRYDMELYDSRALTNNQVFLAKRGFSPRKCFDDVSSLYEDIRSLLHHEPNTNEVEAKAEKAVASAEDSTNKTMYACGLCDKAGAGLKRCGRCKLTGYCSLEHQREHWAVHKSTCKSVMVTAAAVAADGIKKSM